MALTAESTRDEVIAEIVENLDYRTTDSVTKARVLVAAYDHFLLRFAFSLGQNGQSQSQNDVANQYRKTRDEAARWLDQQSQAGVTSGRRDQVYLSVSDFRS